MKTNIEILRDKIRDAGLEAFIEVRETESFDGELYGYEMTDDGGVHGAESWSEIEGLVNESIKSYYDLEC